MKNQEMTFEKKMLKCIIIDRRNEIIGDYENSIEDGTLDENAMLTKEMIVNTIMDTILNGNAEYISSPVRCIAIERKHLKFFGKAFIKSLVEDVVRR